MGNINPGSQQARLNPTSHDSFSQEDPGHHQGPQEPHHSSQEDDLASKTWTVELNKASKGLMILIIIFLLVNLALLSMISFAIYGGKTDPPPTRGALESMSANLKADPIMDLQIINKDSVCPDGFEPLLLSIWPGNVAGCLGEGGDLFDLPCENMTSVDGGKDIPSNPPLDIYEINNSIWCGKRAVLGTDYVKKAECPIGYQECYPGGCFLNKDCPITKVEIPAKGKDLVLTKTQGELPLVNLQASLNDIPCFNRGLTPKSNSSYKLSAGKEDGCDKYGLDHKFSARLSSQPILDSYTQNAFGYDTMNLPYFEKYSRNTISTLSSRVRMLTAKNDYCQDLDRILIINSVEGCEMASPIPLVIFLALCIETLLFLFLIIKSAEVFKLTSCKVISLFYILLSGFIISMIQFNVVFYFSQTMKEMKQHFVEYELLGCFGDGQGSLVIRDHLEIFNQIEMLYWLRGGLVISHILACLACSWLLYIFLSSRPKNLNDPNLQRLSTSEAS